MKTLRNLILTITLALGTTSLLAVDGPEAPSLQQALKLKSSQAIVFRTTQMPGDALLNLTHIRAGDGSVKPGTNRGAMLVIYSSVPDENGDHAVLYQDPHFFTPGGSPVLSFKPFNPNRDAANFVVNGRCGIIAILIGLSQPRPNAPVIPGGLPGADTIAAEITPSDSSLIGLLLPAVQKVREAAK